jgi:nitroreductase
MNPIPADTLLDALRWRYATRRFDPDRKIPAATWSALEDALVLTPSSYGLQPWKFLVVTDPALRQKLLPNTYRQHQVVDCSHLLVLAVKKQVSATDIDKFVHATAQARNLAVDSLAGLRRMMVGDLLDGPRSLYATEWATRQAYIALGNFLTCAALLGIDTCPMEGFVTDKYDEILGLAQQGLTTAVLCPAGYRSPSDTSAHLKKVRFSKADVIQYL